MTGKDITINYIVALLYEVGYLREALQGEPSKGFSKGSLFHMTFISIRVINKTWYSSILLDSSDCPLVRCYLVFLFVDSKWIFLVYL